MKGKHEMKKKVIFWLLTVLAVLAVIFALICIFLKNARVVDDREDVYIAYSGGSDLYHASREELIGMSLCDYHEASGKVETAKEAAEIAEKIIKEAYGNDESPYIVKYNENADAWIVHGSLPLFHVGGVANVAIDKETGEIIMLFHTK